MWEREHGDGTQMARKQWEHWGEGQGSEASEGEAKDKVREDEKKRWCIKMPQGIYTILRCIIKYYAVLNVIG